jgi:hypothetical protein
VLPPLSLSPIERGIRKDARHLPRKTLRLAAQNVARMGTTPWATFVYTNKYLTILLLYGILRFVILELCTTHVTVSSWSV